MLLQESGGYLTSTATLGQVARADRAAAAAASPEGLAFLTSDRQPRTSGVIALGHGHVPRPYFVDGTAGGKLIQIDPTATTPTMLVSQYDRSGNAAVCGCGNAVVAGMEFLRFFDYRIALVQLPRGESSVAVRRRGRILWSIAKPPAMRPLTAGAFRGVSLDITNNYAVIAAAPDGTAGEFAKTLIRDTEVERVAVVQPDRTTPTCRFYGTNGAHPSIPMTGAAAVSLARDALPNLNQVRAIRSVQGVEPLPSTSVDAHGWRVELPKRQVIFTPAVAA